MEARNVGEWAAMAEESINWLITDDFNVLIISLLAKYSMDLNPLKRTQPKNMNVVYMRVVSYLRYFSMSLNDFWVGFKKFIKNL